MAKLIELKCTYCPDVAKVDAACVKVTCGRCVLKLAGARQREALSREVRKCPHHRGYKALRLPSSGCKTCTAIYHERWGK